MYISAFGSLTDTAGHRWEADPATYSSPQGQTLASRARLPATAMATNPYIAGVADAAQMRLYQHARYGFQYSNPIGDFTYTFGIPPGVYSVTLKFADYTAGFPPNYFGLNFVANGVRLLNNYNFASEAGAARTAVDRVFTVQNLTNSLACSSIMLALESLK
jgi:Di-glucose binding within endoplasmic reticulum.